MSDPIGTSGGRHRGIIDTDLSAVIAGGDEFTKRLRQLAELKREHNEALDNLNLGRNVVAAHKEAEKHHKHAKDAHEAAQGVLLKAREEAERLIKDARVTAAAIVADGRMEAETIVSRANETANNAQIDRDNAAKLHSEVSSVHQNAQASLKRADEKQSELDFLREGLRSDKRDLEAHLKTLVTLKNDLLKLFAGAGL
jgi:cell division septum initiation protein DivIVA